MQHNKTTILLSLLLLCSFACTEDIPDFELGRYEYAGIDNKNWRFFRVENGGVYREVSTKATGIGSLKQLTLCEDFLLERLFYHCGFFPAEEKPYFDFRENEVEIRVLANWRLPSRIITDKFPYKIEGDSLFVDTGSFEFKFSRLGGPKRKILEVPWIVSYAKGKLFSLNPVIDQLTEQERLHQAATKEKLIVGDTIAYLLFKEQYIKP